VGREKSVANRKKHGISFEKAMTVFDDALFLIFDDTDHSIEKKRFIIMGGLNDRLLVVAFPERNNATRLISARKATSAERKFYEEEG
jgi:uncharacterized protein